MQAELEATVRTLFTGTVCSAQTDEARGRVLQALRDALGDGDSLPALGALLAEYGTLSAAGQLAGYDPAEISAWQGSGDAGNRRALLSQFRRARLLIYLLALCAVLAVVAVFDLLFRPEWEYGAALFVFLTLALWAGWRLHKSTAAHRYDALSLLPDAREALEALRDRYTKRLLNSAFLSAGGFFFLGLLLTLAALTQQMRLQELIQQVSLKIGLFELGAYLIVKNGLCLHWVCGALPPRSGASLRRHGGLLAAAAIAYWLIVGALLVALRNHISYHFNLLCAAGVLFLALCAVYNLTLRRALVAQNVVVNKRRAAAFSLAALVLVAYYGMQMGAYWLQPYISTVSAVDYTPDEIAYDDETGVYTITTEKEAFRILQLTDIHLGGSAASVVKDWKALSAVHTLIQATEPDLVVVTGDLVFPMGIGSLSLNNEAPILQFASFMRNLGVPWVFTYGNHDTESLATSSAAEIEALFCSLSYRTSQTLLYPYTQPEITGRSNQLVALRNADGSLREAIFLLDSNDYTGAGMNDYDYIHDDQVDWYAAQVQALSAQESRVVPSLLFFHIPLQEYRTAYELYVEGSDEVTYFFGENGESMIDKVCCSDYPSRLFDTAVELGSTRAMFCGHDHYNNLSVAYRGIRLTYGMSIDYLAMPGIEHDTAQRGGTLITVHRDGGETITQVPLTSLTP